MFLIDLRMKLKPAKPTALKTSIKTSKNAILLQFFQFDFSFAGSSSFLIIPFLFLAFKYGNFIAFLKIRIKTTNENKRNYCN